VSDAATAIFATWRYFVIPLGVTGALRGPLLGLAPHVQWPDQGIRWRNDGGECLLGVPPGQYPAWAEAAIAPYEITYEAARELCATAAWQGELAGDVDVTTTDTKDTKGTTEVGAGGTLALPA